MKTTKLSNSTVLILETGEEVIATLTKFAKERHISAGHFAAIGAFSGAAIGYYDMDKKDYLRNEVKEQVEVVSLIGDIALDKGSPKIHAHAILGRRDGSAMAGHLLDGYVRPTLEIVLEDSDGKLQRRFDPQSGLALIDPGKE